MLLDKKLAAERLSICTDTLMAELHAGRLIGFKIGGRWRFDTRDLDQYIENRRQEAAESATLKTLKNTPAGKVVQIKKNRASADPPLDLIWVPGKKIEDVCAEQLEKMGIRR